MLNVAIKAARAAGAIINRAALDVESVRISQKQINDFVTEVDHFDFSFQSRYVSNDRFLQFSRFVLKFGDFRAIWRCFCTFFGELNPQIIGVLHFFT